MGSFSIWHWLILLVVVALVFGGKGKISSIMGDVASGIRNFKDGLKDPNNDAKAIADKHETVEASKTEVKQS
jgi:sec-independent protein translocase protein TatA